MVQERGESLLLVPFAALRTRSSALCTLARPCVRCAFCSKGSPWPAPFPPPLRRLLVGLCSRDFFGTTGLSDFPWSFIIWRASLDFPMRPVTGPQRSQATMGSPGSRARCFRACAGSSTARVRRASRDADTPGVAFRVVPRRRHPEFRTNFAAQYPARTYPCQRFASPRGRRRMTRGRCGSLHLHRMTLSFTTPHRFCRRYRRGRNASFPAPPAQIPACGATAPGSCLR